MIGHQINPVVNGVNAFQQPARFGGGSVGNIMAPWYDLLGQPSMMPMVDGTVDLKRTHEQFPAAMTGLLKSVCFLNELIILSGQSVYLGEIVCGLQNVESGVLESLVCPRKFQEQIESTWRQLTFDNYMTDYVPEEGVSRIMAHSSETMSAKSLRRGVAAMFEYGFLTTTEGMRIYAMTIQQLVLSAKLTEQYDIACTLLACHDKPEIWAKYYGALEAGTDFKSRLAQSIANFAIIHRERGLHRLSDQARDDFDKLGGVPNMWLVPRQVFQWTDKVPEWSTSYLYAGPQGVERLLAGPSTTHMIGGLPAYEMPSFARIKKNARYGLMQDLVQIGEWVPLFHTDTEQLVGTDANPGPNDRRTVQKYQEQDDRFMNIDIIDIVKNAISITLTDVEWADYLGQELMGHLRLTPGAHALAGGLRERILAFYQDEKEGANRRRTAMVSGILWNPWMTYLTFKAILLRGGADLGATLHGHPNFMLAADAKVKTIYGNFTYWGKCIIWGYKNVLICRNIMYSTYERGNGRAFFSENDINFLRTYRYEFNDIDPSEPVCFFFVFFINTNK
jgi:hypothetical protein